VFHVAGSFIFLNRPGRTALLSHISRSCLLSISRFRTVALLQRGDIVRPEAQLLSLARFTASFLLILSGCKQRNRSKSGDLKKPKPLINHGGK
jgi:hypothetical protein